MSDETKKKDGPVDPELNDLLDSALEDFDKPPKANVIPNENQDVSSTLPATSPETSEKLATDMIWSQDFMNLAVDEFEKKFQNLMQNEGDSDLGSSLQTMAQSVANAIGTNPESGTDGDDPDFQSAIAQALKDFSATSERLQNASPGITEADLAAMFSHTSLDEGLGDALPFMQSMMQSLLSKEVLYPSLKGLADKYPAWLEEKKSTLSADDLERYKKQLDLMQKVCEELDKEKEDDTEVVKKQRFDTILSLMQEMQNYGQPLEELVGDQQSAFLQFDPDGNPVLPSLPGGIDAPQNCIVM